MNNSEFLKNFNNLFGSQPPELYGKLCEFADAIFDLESSAFFEFDEESKLKFLAKSSGTRKSFSEKETYFCKSCQILQDKNKSTLFDVHEDCRISLTDVKMNEGSLLFKTLNNNFLFKFLKRSPFTEEEIKSYEEFGLLSSGLIKSTFVSKTGLATAGITASISNELRTPSNNIMGFASLLSEDKLTNSQSEYVSTLKEAALNQQSLIDDLIELAKIENGNAKEVRSKINLRSYCGEIINQLNQKNADVSIQLNISNDIPDNIIIDATKLRYILISLIGYSLRLTENGKINLNLISIENKRLNFRIIDTSNGLTSKQIKSFFEPFAIFRLGNTKIGGVTGLSLTLAKKYVELMDGQIEIQSNIRKGNVYNISVKAEKVNAIEDKISSLPQPSSENKVLVVEDDYATSKILNNYLTKWGYKPDIVNYASEALKALEEKDYLAILMDIALPDSSGFELLEKIREKKEFRNIPVIVCSVEAEQQKAFLMGAVEYFVKPINYSYLVEVLQNYKLKQDSNILIVDDDIPTLNLIKEAVQKLKFNPVAESDSTKVYNLVKDMRLDLAIIDLEMPEVSGYDLIKQLKLNPHFTNLPVIIYTGKENYQEELPKIDGMFEELLKKNSTNIEDLSETINRMINRYDEPVKTDAKTKPSPTASRILLVEDYKHSQIIVTRLLKKNNFEYIEVVENGVEALEIVKKEKFDLILMDMQMPIMNGFEATEKIRELPEYKNTPIIALTAFAMKGDKEKCLEAGATDYIPKPIDSQEFIDKVKQYTETKLNIAN